jgi:hypothetical protein
MATIRETIADIIAGKGAADKKARLICGYLSCEIGLDNGNGWYDDDPEMADDGLLEAETAWLKRNGRD